MDSVSTVMVVGTIATVVLGGLLGLLRGSKRAFLRLLLLAVCFLVAYSACGGLSDKVMSMAIKDGKTIEVFLKESFTGEDGEAIVDIMMPILTALVKLMCFMILFGACQLVSWLIIFPILKLILRPILRKKIRGRLLGFVIGLVGGAVVAFAMFVPTNGLYVDLGKIANIDLSNAVGTNEDGTAQTNSVTEALDKIKATGIADYEKTDVCKFYTGIGGSFYEKLTTVTTAEGKETKLSVQIDALAATATFANKTIALQNVMTEDGKVNTDTIRDFAQAISELDELTPEVKEAMNNMVKTVVGTLGDDIPDAVKNLDIENLDYKNESALLVDVADIADTVAEDGNLDNVDVESVVENLSKSTVVLPALAETSVKVPDNEDLKQKANDAIAKLEAKTGDEAVDEKTIEQLKLIFGLKASGDAASDDATSGDATSGDTTGDTTSGDTTGATESGKTTETGSN